MGGREWSEQYPYASNPCVGGPFAGAFAGVTGSLNTQPTAAPPMTPIQGLMTALDRLSGLSDRLLAETERLAGPFNASAVLDSTTEGEIPRAVVRLETMVRVVEQAVTQLEAL